MNDVSISNLSVPGIFSNITIEIPRGQSVAILGESGIGKTTFALALLGYLSPGLTIEGSLKIFGLCPFQLKPAALRAFRRRIAYVDQDPGSSLPPHHSVRRIFQEHSEQHCSDENILELLRCFDLNTIPNILERTPRQLSGGQRRRLGVAAAIASAPSLLIIDEPTAGIDNETLDLVVRTLTTAQRQSGATCVVITHDIDVAKHLAQHSFLMTTQGFQRLALPEQEPILPRVEEKPNGDPVLRIQNLSVFRHGVALFRDFNLDLHAGEIIGISGRSGSGKTTLLRTILGLHNEYSGEIILDGEPLRSPRPTHVARKFGWVPQEAELSLNPHVPVASILGRTGADQTRIRTLLCKLQLPDLLSRTYRASLSSELSGGQRQRLSLARALLTQPDILLCDEPTSALDNANARIVLQALREAKTATIIVSHDPNALACCDRVVCL